MKRLSLFILMIGFLFGELKAQPPKGDTLVGYRLPYVVHDNDTLPIYVLEDTRVEEKLEETDIKKQKEWNRMLYDVMKTYPYAMAVANKLQRIQKDMDTLDRNKDKKRYLKSEEDRLKTEYTKKLEELSPRQGKILALLISRQTGRTSYDLIKEYKNGISAFFWQSVAGFYGVSLKATYDPNDEPQLEAVLRYLGYQ